MLMDILDCSELSAQQWEGSFLPSSEGFEPGLRCPRTELTLRSRICIAKFFVVSYFVALNSTGIYKCKKLLSVAF